MKRRIAFVGILFSLLARTAESQSPDEEPRNIEEGSNWSGSISVSTYVTEHSDDFASPVVTADHGSLHLESRYNYEALQTGSIWVGYNMSRGDKLEIAATPMLGLVFGDTTGIAPGYNVSLSYANLELSTQGEYLFDTDGSAGNFFYTWSELTYAPVDWFRAGIVIERTKVLGTDLDVRRGPLLAFTHGPIDFATYWLDPGSSSATFVFAVTAAF